MTSALGTFSEVRQGIVRIFNGLGIIVQKKLIYNKLGCSNFFKGGIYREQIVNEMYDIAADNDSEEDRSHPIPELPHWHHES